jgi:hypothetical protein
MREFAKNLERKKEICVTQEEADSIVERVIMSVDSSPQPGSSIATVRLAPVYTYVDSWGKNSNSTTHVVVPAFACHWAIAIEHPDLEFPIVYHLVFHNPDDKPGMGKSTMDNARIRFEHRDWLHPSPNTKLVGSTHLDTSQVTRIGQAMIREFGNYHRVFWNCQTFAKCFLRVITDNAKADFDNWTTADTSRLFLAAFIVGAPFASTSKVVENNRMEKLVEQFDDISNELSAIEQSRLAISAIYDSLRANKNIGEGEIVEDETDKLGFIKNLFKRLLAYSNSKRKRSEEE